MHVVHVVKWPPTQLLAQCSAMSSGKVLHWSVEKGKSALHLTIQTVENMLDFAFPVVKSLIKVLVTCILWPVKLKMIYNRCDTYSLTDLPGHEFMHLNDLCKTVVTPFLIKVSCSDLICVTNIVYIPSNIQGAVVLSWSAPTPCLLCFVTNLVEKSMSA